MQLSMNTNYLGLGLGLSFKALALPSIPSTRTSTSSLRSISTFPSPSHYSHHGGDTISSSSAYSHDRGGLGFGNSGLGLGLGSGGGGGLLQRTLLGGGGPTSSTNSHPPHLFGTANPNNTRGGGQSRGFLTNLRRDIHLKSLERVANSSPHDVHAQYEFLYELSRYYPDAVIVRFEQFNNFAVDERIGLLYLNALQQSGRQDSFGIRKFVERLQAGGGGGAVYPETIRALEELGSEKHKKGEMAGRASKLLSGGGGGGGRCDHDAGIPPVRRCRGRVRRARQFAQLPDIRPVALPRTHARDALRPRPSGPNRVRRCLRPDGGFHGAGTGTGGVGGGPWGMGSTSRRRRVPTYASTTSRELPRQRPSSRRSSCT